MAMTVDELIQLAEAFVGDTTIADLRRSSSPIIDVIAGFSDEQYALLVRFMGGERPTAPQPTVGGPFVNPWDLELLEGPPDLEPLPKTVEENGKTRRMTANERWAAATNPNGLRPEREDPDKPLTLKGEFDGVSLP